VLPLNGLRAFFALGALFKLGETRAKCPPLSSPADSNMYCCQQDHDCDLCKGVTREVSADGSVRYMNGDRTSTQSNNSKGCTCGFKHFWDGNEYDNVPKV
jgi:hypothetical protein